MELNLKLQVDAKQHKKAMEKFDKFDNEFFTKSVCRLTNKLIDDNIDFRIYPNRYSYTQKNINVIILKKRLIPNYFQKKSIIKSIKEEYKNLVNNTRIKVFYCGDVIIDHKRIIIPSHPNCKSYLTKN